MPKTVLLADDSLTIQRVVALTLANEDVNLTSVRDGNQAVEALGQTPPPDLVLADIGMPGRTGYEVAEFVRQQPGRLGSLPVLLLAGAFEPVDEARARSVGANGVLTKPFEPSVLIGKVNELLAESRAGLDEEEPEQVPDVFEPDIPFHPDPETPVSFVRPLVEESVTVPVAVPEMPMPSMSAPSPSSSTSDNYFDKLDQAFEALARTPRPPLNLVAQDPVEPAEAAPELEVTVEEEEATSVNQQDANSPRSVQLSDAFSALLEAERAGVVTPQFSVGAIPPPANGVDIDAISSQITRRVLEQLSDRIVRETVAEIVSTTAERLVREEIEQVKRNIT